MLQKKYKWILNTPSRLSIAQFDSWLGPRLGLMALDTVTDWPFTPSSIRTLRWRISQACLIGLAHSLSKIYLSKCGKLWCVYITIIIIIHNNHHTGCFQQVQTKNFNVLTEAVMNRQSSTPLVTISNHKSCIDDPVICSKCQSCNISVALPNLQSGNAILM